MATRLIPSSAYEDEQLIDRMANAMLDSDFGQILAVAPYGFKDYDEHGTSINPAWRDAVWSVSIPLSRRNVLNFDACAVLHELLVEFRCDARGEDREVPATDEIVGTRARSHPWCGGIYGKSH